MLPVQMTENNFKFLTLYFVLFIKSKSMLIGKNKSISNSIERVAKTFRKYKYV